MTVLSVLETAVKEQEVETHQDWVVALMLQLTMRRAAVQYRPSEHQPWLPDRPLPLLMVANLGQDTRSMFMVSIYPKKLSKKQSVAMEIFSI